VGDARRPVHHRHGLQCVYLILILIYLNYCLSLVNLTNIFVFYSNFTNFALILFKFNYL
jgi:hypothetical protein